MRLLVHSLHRLRVPVRGPICFTSSILARQSSQESQLFSSPLIPSSTSYMRSIIQVVRTPSWPQLRPFSSSIPSMTVTKVKSREQFEKLLCGNKPLLIDFCASWCAPCKMIGPIFDELSCEISALEFVSVDVEDKDFGLEFAQAHGIRAMPTFQIIEKGIKIAEMVGADQSKLRAMVADYCT